MSTITISLTGSAITGLTGTNSKAYTLSDTDLQSLLNWAQIVYSDTVKAMFNTTTPTPQQVLLAWVQNWVNQTISGIQQLNTPVPVVPPPISMQ